MRIVSTCSQHLWDVLAHAYAVLGFEAATGRDEVFKALALVRLIEPTSTKQTNPSVSTLGKAPGRS